MRTFPRALACMLLLAAAGLSAQTASPPVTGLMLPGMERFDAAVTGLMTKLNSPGAQLAITRSGRLVLARGYGFADRDASVPVQPDALFRVASLSKFVTAVAILTLVQQGKLDLDMKVFPFLGLTPLPGVTNLDARLQTITVRQLLHHTGGWDRDISGDFTYSTTLIANAAGVPPPANVDTVIRYYLGLRLDFDPGTRYAYSNLGFFVLGRVIEKITGQSYVDYVQANVLGKAGITRSISGRSLLADRQPGEVRYYDYPGAPLVSSVFPPTTDRVPGPYGGFVIENRYSTGGWLFTAIDYARLLGAIDGSRPGAGILNAASITLLTERPAAPIAATSVNFYAMALNMNVANGTGLQGNWFHDGALSGTATYMVRFSSGWSYAIFFNTRPQDDSTTTTEIQTAMNTALNATTPPATGDLFLTAKPEMVTAPASQIVSPGATATFTTTVTSVTAPTYQWFKDNTAIAGATSATLTVSNASAASAGVYQAVITNTAGAITGSAATLSVGAVSNTGRLTNLSILTALSGSTDNFTMGYVVGGAGTSGAKQLVIRAAGPSLGALGVGGTLADPKLELFAGATKTGENDDWGGSSTTANAMASVGAFAYSSPTSKDAAVAAIVTPGDNSVKVSGTGAGLTIAEIYDATPTANFTAATPRLVNVSVLKQLGSGFTVGFVVGGSTSAKILVRAVGPALGAAPFNIPGVVADPQLTLFSGPNKIGENNDWGGAATLSAAFTQVGAFALPAASKDAAVLATLAPGNYSVQVSGGGGTGLVLVEVYEVP